MIARALAGLVIAAAIALLARRHGSLSRSGALAALVTGTVCAAAGWGWAVLLVAFFVVSSTLSRFGEREKAARTGSVVAKGGERDALQVAANGGLFALAAVLSLGGWAGWAAAGAGALAAATADTWGTEIGTLAGRPPRSLLGWRPVPAGTSGAVSAPGSAATLAGALFIALLARALGWTAGAALAALAGGVAGALTDSLLGATLQARRWCATCGVSTERLVHGCGDATTHAAGARWLDNDAVNLLSTAAGALVALGTWSIVS